MDQKVVLQVALLSRTLSVDTLFWESNLRELLSLLHQTVGLVLGRGLLSAKVPKSPFAEAHSVLLPEPTHMEDDDEDQENEKEDERDGEECKVESRRESKQPLRMKHG